MTQRTTSDAQVASTGAFLPDSWSCWEGSVILSTGKETFEVLGLPGAKLSARMPGAPDQHRMPTFHDLYYFSTLTHHRPVINVSLNTQGANTNVRSHDFILDSFTQWDRSRERSGQGQWDFAFHVSHPGALIYMSRCAYLRGLVCVCERKDLFVPQTKGRVRFRPRVPSVIESSPSFKTSKMSASRPLLCPRVRIHAQSLPGAGDAVTYLMARGSGMPMPMTTMRCKIGPRGRARYSNGSGW